MTESRKSSISATYTWQRVGRAHWHHLPPRCWHDICIHRPARVSPTRIHNVKGTLSRYFQALVFPSMNPTLTCYSTNKICLFSLQYRKKFETELFFSSQCTNYTAEIFRKYQISWQLRSQIKKTSCIGSGEFVVWKSPIEKYRDTAPALKKTQIWYEKYLL